jgi:hypothetical protein
MGDLGGRPFSLCGAFNSVLRFGFGGHTRREGGTQSSPCQTSCGIEEVWRPALHDWRRRSGEEAVQWPRLRSLHRRVGDINRNASGALALDFFPTPRLVSIIGLPLAVALFLPGAGSCLQGHGHPALRLRIAPAFGASGLKGLLGSGLQPARKCLGEYP